MGGREPPEAGRPLQGADGAGAVGAKVPVRAADAGRDVEHRRGDPAPRAQDCGPLNRGPGRRDLVAYHIGRFAVHVHVRYRSGSRGLGKAHAFFRAGLFAGLCSFSVPFYRM